MKIYDTLSKQKRELIPLEESKIKIYVCGMTVYDYCHLGHARMLVGFDMVTRYLRSRGYHVTYVRNITDIDDKIINRANELNESFTDLSQRFIEAMDEDAYALGIIPPDFEPRATDHIPTIISMIERLIERDYAYVGDNGDVYYSVEKFAGYGKLSGKDIENLQVGARIEINENKRDPLDFVLWKAVKPGEPSWSSPWGHGRPGWHIECSAMSTAQLGNTFDIHGGGPDLIFPHHENEIAQTEGATGQPFVNTWMHVGALRINSEKMSKSLGNFFTIRDILKKYPGEVIRYFLLSSHYRSPINYSEENLEGAWAALTRFYTALRGIELPLESNAGEYETRFYEAMDDDFNTPEALAALFDLVREVNRLREDDSERAAELAAGLKQLGGVLGFLQQDPDEFLQAGDSCLNTSQIETMIEERNAARTNKDWAEADRLRDALLKLGVVLEDGPEGTTWRRHIEEKL